MNIKTITVLFPILLIFHCLTADDSTSKQNQSRVILDSIFAVKAQIISNQSDIKLPEKLNPTITREGEIGIKKVGISVIDCKTIFQGGNVFLAPSSSIEYVWVVRLGAKGHEFRDFKYEVGDTIYMVISTNTFCEAYTCTCIINENDYNSFKSQSKVISISK